MFFDNITLLPEAIEKNMLPALEIFPCAYNTLSEPGIIRIVFPEFTCVCPKTGYPDFASIHLLYLPESTCLELKSWKLYLNAFRMIGTFHETVTAHLYKTLTYLLKPRWLLLAGDFFPRGNVNTTVFFETQTPRPQGVDLLLSRDFLKLHCKGFE